MKPFIVKRQEESSVRLEELRLDEIAQVAGGCDGMECCDITVTGGTTQNEVGKWDPR